MKVYRVIVVGMGKRGKHHAAAFKNNPRFELAGLCSRDRGRLDAAAAEFGPVRTDTDPLALGKAVRPDVFCFCTPPSVRLPLIEAGIASGARLIAYEKPMALSMNEAIAIRQAVQEAGVNRVALSRADRCRLEEGAVAPFARAALAHLPLQGAVDRAQRAGALLHAPLQCVVGRA